KQKIDRGMRALINEGMRDNSIRECDPKITAFAIAGAMNWVAHWYKHDESLTAEDIAQRFIELFDQGLQPR
ncbi:MAG: TetR/AcrR family transcriptional regulator, partial [Steroidobacteraceae bacterium]